MTNQHERSATGVVLAAGGSGTRFGSLKQFMNLAGRPMLHWSLDAFALTTQVKEIVVVCPDMHLAEGEVLVGSWRAESDEATEVQVCAGGARRQDSVRCGLEALSDDIDIVLVHDAARPLVESSDVVTLIDTILADGAGVIGTPCFDSVKRVVDGGIAEEIPRDEVWTVQTPQGAERSRLIAAYERAGDSDFTDESSLLRGAGERVTLVEGSRENIKVTRPGDERLAELILAARES